MTQRVLLHMTAPLREDFDIPYHDIGEELGPSRIALVAGLYSNELNGVFVLSRLAAFLQEVATGQQAGLQLRQGGITSISPSRSRCSHYTHPIMRQPSDAIHVWQRATAGRGPDGSR